MKPFLIVSAFLLLLTPTFALDRVVVRNNRGQVIGGIVSKGGKSVYVDRKGKAVAIGVNSGRNAGVVVLTKEPHRTSRPSSVFPRMPSWKK